MTAKANIPVAELLRLLRNGWKCRQIAKHFDVSNKTLSLHIRWNKINSRSVRFDTRFFETIDSESRAYWLGYIMADGCVTITQSNRVEVSSKDIEHLKKWNAAIRSPHRILMSYGKYGKSVHCSKEMVDDLIRHGVVPRKSLTLRFPTTIPEQLIRHFIRGYFDGDGCLSLSRKPGRRSQVYVSFVGTGPFVASIRDILGITNAIRPRGNVFVMECTGNMKAKRILDYLYEDATVYLDRKHALWQKFCHTDYLAAA